MYIRTSNRTGHPVPRAAASIGLVVGAVFAMEVLLQVAAALSPVVDRASGLVSRMIEDPVYLHRGNPRFREHDASGFRNATRPETADIAVLGDSQTYGTNVVREQAWPAVLATLANVPRVYNMGLGGYGPLRNLLFAEEALALHPKLALHGFYFGNDFFDAFSFANKTGRLKELVPPGVLREIERLESQKPLGSVVSRLFHRGRSAGSVKADKLTIVPRARLWLLRNSRVWGVLERVVLLATSSVAPTPAGGLLSKDFDTAVGALQPFERQFASPFAGPGWRTILTAPYRNRVMDDSDIRIRTGVDIAKVAIKAMHDLFRAEGVEFMVVLIPTKESVFWPKVSRRGDHEQFAALVENEDRLRRELIRFLDAERIRYVDVLPSLRRSVSQPYFEDADGHPNALGHKVIASAVADSVIGLLYRGDQEISRRDD